MGYFKACFSELYFKKSKMKTAQDKIKLSQLFGKKKEEKKEK